MRAKRFLAGIVAFLAAGAASAGTEIFRCEEDGRVIYADRQCGAASVLVVATASGIVSSHGVPVELGMSPRMVHQVMGRPRETVATLEGRSLVEYWTWRHGGGGTTRVAFREGRVTRVDAR